MLELHRIDLRIVEAIASIRGGGTIHQIHERLADQNDRAISIDSVKRHLPGLVRLGAVRGEKAFRDEQMVTIWLAVLERQPTNMAASHSISGKSGECVETR